MDRHGHRYPKELDVASPRYRERPGEIFTLLKTLASSSDPALTPQGVFADGIERREETVQFLVRVLEKKGRRRVELIENNKWGR